MASCRSIKRVAEHVLRCTEPAGHAGAHKARGIDGTVLRRWPRKRADMAAQRPRDLPNSQTTEAPTTHR